MNNMYIYAEDYSSAKSLGGETLIKEMEEWFRDNPLFHMLTDDAKTVIVFTNGVNPNVRPKIVAGHIEETSGYTTARITKTTRSDGDVNVSFFVVKVN